MQENIVRCRKCEVPLCYERRNDDYVAWDCLVCGYASNTLFMKNTDAVLEYEKSLPTLFKDIKFVDKEGYIWYPTVITKEGVGIVYPDVDGSGSWKWAFSPHVEVKEEEKEKFKNKEVPGTYHKYKTDIAHTVHFDQDKFAHALEYAGLY
jgi:hypothetical protein